MLRRHPLHMHAATRRPDRDGYILLEAAVALPIALIALGMLVQMLTGGSALRRTGSESWVAVTAAQAVLETMRNEDFRQLVALYNAEPLDDPRGPGTAPGATFPVTGLTPASDDADGLVGEVILPLVNTGTPIAPRWEVREDMENPLLGMPRDLSGDVAVDALDHAEDFTLLPILVELRWTGKAGPRRLRVQTILGEWR